MILHAQNWGEIIKNYVWWRSGGRQPNNCFVIGGFVFSRRYRLMTTYLPLVPSVTGDLVVVEDGAAVVVVVAANAPPHTAAQAP